MTSGGSNDACVSQVTLDASTSSPLAAEITHMPYVSLRSTRFLVSRSIRDLYSGRERHRGSGDDDPQHDAEDQRARADLLERLARQGQPDQEQREHEQAPADGFDRFCGG